MKLRKNWKKILLVSGSTIAFASVSIITSACSSNGTNTTYSSSYTINDSFKIKDYNGLDDIEITTDAFKQALKNYGATKNKPLEIDYITPYSSLGPLNTTMYNTLASEINSISNGLIKFQYLFATNTNPSSSSWFTGGNSEMGFILWSPDYDGVGTWISAWINMDKDGNNVGNYLNVWEMIHERTRNVLINKDEYVSTYGQDYYDAASDLLTSLVEAGLYKSYSVESPTEIPEDYKKAFTNLGESNSGSLKTDYFLSQYLVGNLNLVNYLISIIDTGYVYIPLSGTGLNYRTPSLLDPQFIYRNSGFVGSQLRDIGVKKEGTYTPLDNTTRGTYKYITSSGFFDTSSQSFNQSFGNAIPVFGQDVGQIGLVGIEITGNYDNDDPSVKPTDHLRLEGATSVTLYDKDNNNLGTFKREDDLDLNDENLGSAVKSAVKYEFTIDTNLKWVDYNGDEKQSLSGKDYERGFETYWLASDINLQANSYFIDSLNLDLQSTVNYGQYVTDITSTDYDIDNFTNDDNKFTLVVSEPNSFLLQYLTQGYFYAMPYTNEEVKNIKVTTNEEDAIYYDSSSKTYEPNWGKIYGNGKQASDILSSSDTNFWSATAYYLNNIVEDEVTYKKNEKYFEVRTDLLNSDDNIDTYTIKSVPGIIASALYDNFLSGNTSSAIIPTDSESEILNNESLQESIIYTGVLKTSQSNYAIWNGNPYDDNGNLKDTVNSKTAEFLKDYKSNDARIIRAGINGLLNYYAISQIVYTAGDFDYSSIPYGWFTWTETNSEGNETSKELWSELYNGTYSPYDVPSYGGLTRPISEYIKNAVIS